MRNHRKIEPNAREVFLMSYLKRKMTHAGDGGTIEYRKHGRGFVLLPDRSTVLSRDELVWFEAACQELEEYDHKNIKLVEVR